MNDFSILKLERAKWISYLDEENIEKSVKLYNLYIDNLKKTDFENAAVKNEINLCSQLFQIKLNILADKYIRQKNFFKALLAVSAAFKNNKNDINNIKNYITCIDEFNHGDLKLSLIKHLGDISNTSSEIDIENCKYVYKTLTDMDLYAEAITYLEKYINLKGREKTNADDYNNLGTLYYTYFYKTSRNIIDLKKSFDFYMKALDINPNSDTYLSNALVIAYKCNDKEQVKNLCEKLLKLNPFTEDAKYNYSTLNLWLGNFSEWHKYYNSRFLKKHNRIYFPEIKKPQWDGIKDLSGSKLLVHCEQGFGDIFLMWGYIPRLINLAKHVIFITKKETYELLKENEYGVEVYNRDNTDIDKLDFDYHISSMSIPSLLKLDKSNISTGTGYIKPDNKLKEQYKQKYFNNNKLKIGISFLGSKNGDLTRDIPVKEFLLLDKFENIEIYNLTKEAEDSQFEIFKNNKIINIAKDFQNFAQTAAAIANCDVILTADNCILNLAGAIGVRTLAIFNWNYDFRWFDLTGEDVVWYSNVKPFVCENFDDWQSAIIPAINSIEELKYSNISDINNYPLYARNCEQNGLYKDAIELMKKYIAEKDEKSVTADDYNHLGYFYYILFEKESHKYSDLENSLNAYLKAAELAPDINLYNRTAIILAGKIMDFEAGYKCWNNLVKYNIANNYDKFEYSIFCLKAQNFADWHKYYDTRFLRKENPLQLSIFNKPKWDGTQNLSNSVLLIYADTGYGFGDNILIFGYLSRIVKLAKHVIFVTAKELYDLFKNNEYGVEILSKNETDLNTLNYDFYIPAMSVPAVLKLDKSNISTGSGYIKADLALVNEFKEKYFNNNKFKIGISFSGNRINKNKIRDISIEEFKLLDSLENVQIYNLTKEASTKELEILKNNKIINAVENVENFAQTAAVITNCDLVLTSDNCILNLAGALGIKTFGLFNYISENRWFDLTGNDVIWYKSVKPFVCKDMDDWQSAILPAVNEIKQIIKAVKA